MIPLPRSLKRPLVAIWNGAHQLGWAAGEQLDARLRGRRELCTCCGRRAWMLFRARAVPDRLIGLWGLTPSLARALREKETLLCSVCGAPLRSRRLAHVLLELEGESACPSLAAWAATPAARRLAIAEINRIPGVHEAIAPLPGLHASDFHDPDGPADSPDLPHEDLGRLSYDDRTFDYVLTAETLEHVPDLDRALAEIHRILKPGGVHICTIPLLPGVPTTFARRQRLPEGTERDLAPPLRHPGGDVGYPVYTEFGADWPERLASVGFSAECRFGPPSDKDLAQVWICRKI
jgi:SAM-dependent methyltransferase